MFKVAKTAGVLIYFSKINILINYRANLKGLPKGLNSVFVLHFEMQITKTEEQKHEPNLL